MIINSRVIFRLFLVVGLSSVVNTIQFAETKYQVGENLRIDTVNYQEYEPCTFSQDFESGEVSAWSSYPPAQDMAYDPYLYPGKISDNDKGFCLCKLYNPPWNAPQLIGVSKKLSMHLDNESIINFRYFIKTINMPYWLGIDIGLINGDRIRARCLQTRVNNWHNVSYTLADIFKLAGRQPVDCIDITAIALTVRFEKTDPDMPIYFAIDDVEIKGKKTVSFKYDLPKTQKLAEWYSEIALRHYKLNDKLEIAGTFLPSQPDQVIVEIARYDKPEEKRFQSNLELSNGIWQLNDNVTLDEKNFSPGMYKVTLTGIKKEMNIVRSEFTFLIIDNAGYSYHPRLWFDKNGVEDFVARIKTGRFKSVLEDIRRRASEARNNFPGPDIPYDLNLFQAETDWLPALGIYGTKVGGISSGAMYNALVFLIDNDSTAADYAKSALLSMCRWESWQHPWILNRGQHTYYSVGYVGRDLALAFDILYDRISPAERKLIAKAFMEKNVIPAYQGYVVNNLVTTQGSNWIPRITGGALMCMMAIMDEFEDTSVLEPYLSGILYKHKAVLDEAFGYDKGYGEGFGYYGAAAAAFCRSMPSLERIFNIDLSENLNRSYTEIFWSSDPDNNNYFTFGDAGIQSGPAAEMTYFPWLIKKYRDSNLAWLYQIYYQTYYGKNRYSIDEVLYDISDIPAIKPSGLRGAKFFKDVGTLVFRSGEENNDFIFSFRCGPFANHQHIDQGTFFLSYKGELIFTEQGYSSYYTDPIYQSHIIQPVSHNTILINNNPQCQRTGDVLGYADGFNDYASVTDFIGGQSFAFALGDLTPVYLENVEELKRGILYINPDAVLVIDKMTTNENEASMSALFHTPKYNNTSLSNDVFTINSGTVEFQGTVITSENAAVSLQPDPLKLGMYTKEPLEPLGRITVTTETTDGSAYSVVLLADEAPLNKNNSDEKIFVKLKDTEVLINKSKKLIKEKAITSNAYITAVANNGSVLCVEGTDCSVNGRMVFVSDSPVTLLMESGRISYSAKENTIIKLRCSGGAKKVLINGEKHAGCKFDTPEGIVLCEIPKGQGEIVIE